MNPKSIIFIQENAFENVVCQNGSHFVQGVGVGVEGVDLIIWLPAEEDVILAWHLITHNGNIRKILITLLTLSIDSL